jgi:hypothetical protein
MNRLPVQHQHLYRLDDFRLHFGGVRFWGKFASGWLGEQSYRSLPGVCELLATFFFISIPPSCENLQLTMMMGQAPSSLDHPSKLLYNAEDNYLLGILQRQEIYVLEGDTSD